MKSIVRVGTDLVLSHAKIEECFSQEAMLYFKDNQDNCKPTAASLEENQSKVIQIVIPMIILGFLSKREPNVLEAISSTLESQLPSIVEKNQILELLRDTSTMELITDKIICLNIPSLQNLQTTQVTIFMIHISILFLPQF